MTVARWGVREVAEWLVQCDMNDLVLPFAKAGVDGALLQFIDEDTLETSVGVNQRAKRLRLLGHVKLLMRGAGSLTQVKAFLVATQTYQRFSVPAECTLRGLHTRIETVFQEGARLYDEVSYRDADGDSIIVTSDLALRTALRAACASNMCLSLHLANTAVPTRPTMVRLEARGPTAVMLSWSPANSPPGYPVTEYVVEMAISGGDGAQASGSGVGVGVGGGSGGSGGGFSTEHVFVEEYRGAALTHRRKVQTLELGRTYIFRVRAANANGTGLPSKPMVHETPAGVNLVWQHDRDNNGLFYHLGTAAGGTKAYRNPHEAGLVNVTTSSIRREYSPASMLVARGPCQIVTQNVAGSWVCVDIGAERRLMPTRYLLRSRDDYDGHHLRTWRLEGSRDGQKWNTIREHDGDTHLNGMSQLASWSTPQAEDGAQAFRHFRLLQTGPNSDGGHNLCIGNLELYGLLMDVSQAADI